MKIGDSDLEVSPLCLGGNAFGWTADEDTSFAVLDAYAEAGGNFIDTADMYSHWIPGGSGGESERIIGRWMKARGNRDQMVIATKVGALPGLDDLAARTIRRGAEDSLRRLGIDHIDLYYAHVDDPSTPLAETLGAFDALVRAGLVRHIAASNITADRLSAALEISAREGLAPYVALQAEYNLVQREGYERDLAPTVARTGLACLPYVALARGFLTGKYRPGGPQVDSPRADRARAHLEGNGPAVLAALDEVAAAHQTSMAAVSLAWLAAQPTVATPLAGARNPDQLADLLPFLTLRLTTDEVALLDKASAWA
ncbi:aryl-alcohol dehydrogenase-like predicted oxidoreductase [Nonomuraea fuscirosea]|uniref:Aryl-alcohol dehydrogenase-like predicted oxidoreductase n=1 Tax=Nonomuraea fuscirosea TaxID=1291556 RepID=A0A2T0MXH4_9ACTN|nr:aldo/keto reductase [Nonomuraea fuscirosea]PRX63797.1 aryl-alcohol dehydrogenase-like predicted oxidoreductase [Nonomuraea fuscirosea]